MGEAIGGEHVQKLMNLVKYEVTGILCKTKVMAPTRINQTNHHHSTER